MLLLDGKKLAQTMQGEIAVGVAEFARAHGIKPGLAAVLVGDNQHHCPDLGDEGRGSTGISGKHRGGARTGGWVAAQDARAWRSSQRVIF